MSKYNVSQQGDCYTVIWVPDFSPCSSTCLRVLGVLFTQLMDEKSGGPVYRGFVARLLSGFGGYGPGLQVVATLLLTSRWLELSCTVIAPECKEGKCVSHTKRRWILLRSGSFCYQYTTSPKCRFPRACSRQKDGLPKMNLCMCSLTCQRDCADVIKSRMLRWGDLPG